MVEPSFPKKRTTIYLEPNIHNEFKKICFREQESMSQKIEKYVARYVAVHMKGNPQLRLAPFIGKTTHTCFRCEGKFPILIHVKFISGLIANVCRECFKVYKSQTTVDKVLGVTE